MTLVAYIHAMIPLVNLINQEKRINTIGYKNRQLWYIYRQYFYGFAEFIERENLIYTSLDAQREFELIMPGENLKNQNWTNQPKFDLGRKMFNLDHIYSGEMFRGSIDDLILTDNLTIEAISDLIRNNYRMAWILKREEKLLPRANRGKTLNDALHIYRTRGIELLKK